MIEVSKFGVRIGDLDLIVCGIIEKVGYGDYFFYWLGYGFGIFVYEYLLMS